MVQISLEYERSLLVVQELVFDAEKKFVLHMEMAKKNLFVKRGQLPIYFLGFISSVLNGPFEL